MSSKQSQSQITNVYVSPKAVDDMKTILKASTEEKQLDLIDEQVGDRFTPDSFYIAPAFKDAAKVEFKNAKSPAFKEAVLREYYYKSLGINAKP